MARPISKLSDKADLEDILVERAKRYRKLSYVADSLGVSYNLLIYWIQNKLGFRKEEFYRKKVCKSKCKLITINGPFRYKFIKLFDHKCKCSIGYKFLTVRIDDNELKEICDKNGFKIKTLVENDSYLVDK